MYVRRVQNMVDNFKKRRHINENFVFVVFDFLNAFRELYKKSFNK
jgi:hypothetical protein